MHERIVATLGQAISGIRFSVTPYTFGWTAAGEGLGTTSRTEFVADLANTMRTYRPLVELLGSGEDSACIALRFHPLVANARIARFEEDLVEGHHVFSCGAYVCVASREGGRPPSTRITKLSGKTPAYTEMSAPYVLLLRNSKQDRVDWRTLARQFLADTGVRETLTDDWQSLAIAGCDLLARNCSVSLFSNEDGPYFAVDPTFSVDGAFRAKQFHTPTGNRAGGYVDAERYFLNQLLQYKRSMGIRRRDQLPTATWDDVQRVIDLVGEHARLIGRYDPRTGHHILVDVVALVELCKSALQAAEYPASSFFDPGFLVDTGTIVNQGRAVSIFRGIASQEDMPLSPHEERGYGEQSLSSQRGIVWRLAPNPLGRESHNPGPGLVGGKNNPNRSASITFSELDWHNLRPVDPSGRRLREFVVDGVEVEEVTPEYGEHALLFPGLRGRLP